MRSKTLGINVRVTEEEKEKLQQNASCCLLSLSEYLRRLGLTRKKRNSLSAERDRGITEIRKMKQGFWVALS